MRSLSLRRALPRAIIGGALAAAVAATAASAQPVFAGGSTDTRLVFRASDGHAWSMNGNDVASPVFSGPFVAQGGGMIGGPVVVSVPHSAVEAPAPGTPYFIATGIDHNLWVRSESVGWAPLSVSPVYCAGTPAATSVSAHAAGEVLLVVACRGADGALWYEQGTVVSDPATLPSLSGWTSLGGSILDGPAVAAVPPFTDVSSEITFFANGTSGHVVTRTEAAGWTTSGWSCHGHLAAGAVMSTVSVAVFACQGAPHHITAATNTGTGWTTFAIGGSTLNGPGIALGPNSLTLVAEGGDHHLWQDTSLAIAPTSAASFGGWTSLGGRPTWGVSAAALLYQGSNP